MKLKLVEINGNSYAEVVDGKPIVVEDDGRETPIDLAHTRGTIGRLNGEAKTFREKMEAYESRLKSYEGIEDPEAARRALETIKNFDEGKLVAAGKIEEVKASAKKSAEEQVAAAVRQSAEKLKELEAQRDKFQNDLYSEKIGGAFSRSKFIADKTVVPVDMMQAMFSKNFKIEDGRTIAYDAHGNKITSRASMGVEPAEFEEALEILTEQYPNRNQILKGTGSTGSGARPGHNGGGGGKTMSRAEFDRVNPLKQGELIRGGTTVVD